MKLQTLNLSYFLGKIFFGDDGSQSIFAHQATLNTIGLKEDKSTEYVIDWKSKEIYTSKFTPLYTAFLYSINLSGYRTGMQFYNSVLVVAQNNYATKIVNAYILYDVDIWPKFPKLKKCLFVRTNTVKNSVKGKYEYSSYDMAFDGADSKVLVLTLLGMLRFLISK